jgi:hypothetical protein
MLVDFSMTAGAVVLPITWPPKRCGDGCICCACCCCACCCCACC